MIARKDKKLKPIYELVELCGMLDQIKDDRLRESIAFWLKELFNRIMPHTPKNYPTNQYNRQGACHGD